MITSHILFAVLFSSRPVVHLKVSMTFTPSALPIGFTGSVNGHLCFEVSPTTAAAESGNGQPSGPSDVVAIACWLL